MIFANRHHAGHMLAAKLAAYRNDKSLIVIALPRGGVPVAFEVAKSLRVPLDIVVVRKLGTPTQPELAMGAITSGGVRVMNTLANDIAPLVIEAVAKREQMELERREIKYRGNSPRTSLTGKTLLLIDDGLATGASMLAAVRALRRHKPGKMVVAVPVAPGATCRRLAAEVDEVVCINSPDPFDAVGYWYEDFAQVEDDEVGALLSDARELLNKICITTIAGTPIDKNH